MNESVSAEQPKRFKHEGHERGSQYCVEFCPDAYEDFNSDYGVFPS